MDWASAIPSNVAVPLPNSSNNINNTDDNNVGEVDYKKSYLDDRNFYMNFDKDMPGVISENPREIIRAIEKDKYDLKVVKKFALDNVSKVYGGYTANVCKFILKLF